jgi:hypothetical protein
MTASSREAGYEMERVVGAVTVPIRSESPSALGPNIAERAERRKANTGSARIRSTASNGIQFPDVAAVYLGDPVLGAASVAIRDPPTVGTLLGLVATPLASVVTATLWLVERLTGSLIVAVVLLLAE